MRNLHRRDSMSSFIHFSLPLSIPLGASTLHTTTIQMHESRSSIIWRRSRFNFNRWCVFLTSVRDTSRVQISSDTERLGSINCCRTFYNSSWGMRRGLQSNCTELRTELHWMCWQRRRRNGGHQAGSQENPLGQHNAQNFSDPTAVFCRHPASESCHQWTIITV